MTDRFNPGQWRWAMGAVLAVLALTPTGWSQAPTVDQPAPIGDVADAKRMVDPRRDGWDSEAFHDEVNGRLKVLAKAVAEQADEAALLGLASESYKGGSLIPNKFVAVYSDTNTKVERGDAADAAHTGGKGFAEAIAAWTKPWQGASKVRVKFKTVGVTPTDFAGRTEVLIEGVGFFDDRSIQQNATWAIQWKRVNNVLKIDQIKVSSYERVTTVTATGRLLSDCSEAVLGRNPSFAKQLKIGSHDWISRLDRNLGLQTFGHQGLAVGDVNGDGLDDVYVCQGSGLPNRLFVQNGDGSARDVSAAAGVDWLEPTRSALFIDLDNDGDQDLALTTDAHIMLMNNDGKGVFTRKGLLPLKRPGFSLAAADYDIDGDLDLYVCIYFSPSADPNELAQPVPYFNATNGGRNMLWRNDGQTADEWVFKDVTDDVGLNHNNRRWSFAAAWEDVDNDGDLDLYVANDFGPNNLYQNDGGRFKDVAKQANVRDRSFGMSVAFGDANRDGLMDLYVSNMFSSAGFRITSQPRFRVKDFNETRKAFQYLARGNSLFQRNALGGYDDVSIASGTTMGRWSWASQFVDLNNDGWLDIAIANGWQTNELNDDL